MADSVEQRYPLARRSADALISIGVTEAISSGTHPILFYTSTVEKGLKQVTIDSQSIVGVEDARSAERKAKGFVELSGPVEVVALNGEKVKMAAQPKSAVGLHDETISLTFATARGDRKLELPYDALLDGLIDGHHIAKYRVSGADQYHIVHCLVIPQTRETQVVERKGGAHVQTESEVPNIILVFNPQNTKAGIDWSMGSTRDFLRFTEDALIELLNCLDKTDPQRAALREMILKYLKDQALVELEKEVSRAASPITAEPILADLRECLPRRVATQSLAVSQTELPLADQQGEFRVGDQLFVIHDPKVKEGMEKARRSFEDVISPLFVDGNTYAIKIAKQETAILEAAHKHERDNSPAAAELGFPAIAGYHYLTDGLSRVIDEYNQEVERALQSTFYDQVKADVLVKVAALAEAEDYLAESKAAASASQAAAEKAKKEFDDYSPNFFGRFFKNKLHQLEQTYHDAQTKQRLDKATLRSYQDSTQGVGIDIANLITNYGQDIADFFTIAINPRGRAERLRIYYEQLEKIEGQSPKIRIKSPLREGAREEREAADKARAKIKKKIERENNPTEEIIRLRQLRQAIDTITKGMDQYVERVGNEGDEGYSYAYTDDLLRADLLSMDDTVAQRFMVVSAYLADYYTNLSRGVRHNTIPTLDEYPKIPQETRGTGIEINTREFRESETSAGPYHTIEGKPQGGRVPSLINCWLRNRPYSQEADGSPRVVLREEVFDQHSGWLVTFDHPDSVRELVMSRPAWIMEAISELAYMSMNELSLVNPGNNMRILRGKNLVLPPLGLILSEIPRKELPIFALAIRAVISNGGFTLASPAVCDEINYGQIPNQGGNPYLERNSALINYAQYLSQQLSGLLPGLNTSTQRKNFTRFVSPNHPGGNPRDGWKRVRNEISRVFIPAGIA